MDRKIGAHMSIAGGHHLAVSAAQRVGFNAVQVFTKSNNQWKAKSLTESDISAFRDRLNEANLFDPIGHNSYLINMASPDDILWQKSIDAMTIEVERGEALGIVDLVAHPGAHVGSGEEAGICRIAQALDEVHRRTKGVSLRIALETTAGQGSNLGHRFEHLGAIIERVQEPERLSVCVDSCHIFAAGYPLGSIEDYNRTMSDLDKAVGLGRVKVWHLNDSVRELGSRVDRHAGIGLGQIGRVPFGFILNDERFRAVTMILETPKSEDGTDDLDIANLKILRELIQ